MGKLKEKVKQVFFSARWYFARDSELPLFLFPLEKGSQGSEGNVFIHL